MLCSNCSHEVKPIVCVDVDGTLGDYHGHFRDFMEGYFDRKMSNLYEGSMPFKQYWLGSQPWMTEKDWHDAKLAYRQGGMKRTMPILPGAWDLCCSVRNAGAELWITTTRPYLSLDNIVPDTVEWCRRHGIEYDGMLFDEDKYEQLAHRVESERVVAVIDDLPEMYDAAAMALYYGWDVPILARGRYNRAVKRPIMTDLWTAGGISLTRIDKWKESHA